MKQFIHSLHTSRSLTTICSVLVLLIVFSAGIIVGYHKAHFSENWNRGYAQGFNNPRSMLAPFMHDADDVNMNSHGAIGEIVSAHGSELLVKNQFEAEKVVIISSTTIIRSVRTIGTTTSFISGDHILAIGSPDEQGRIRATFIRIIPEGPIGSSSPIQQ